MKTHFSFKITRGQSFLIGLVSLLVISSCKDDPADFGKNILPGNAFIAAFHYDEHHLPSVNVTKDSVRTDDPAYGILGYLNDPEFGLSDADLLFQVSPGARIDSSAFNLGPDYFVDSLVLNLNYQFNWWYGDMFAEHLIKVFELQQPLIRGPYEYFSNMDVNGYYDPNNPVAERLSFVNDDIPDSCWARTPANIWEYPDSLWSNPAYLDTCGNASASHNWRFKLDDALAQRIFEEVDSFAISNESVFKEILKGFYISSELVDPDSEGSLVRLDLFGPGSSLRMYYSYFERDTQSNEVVDTTHLSHNFPINEESVRINRFAHDFQDKIDFNNPDVEHLYVQGMAGSYARLDMPGDFYSWADSLSYKAADGDSIFTGFTAIDVVVEIDTLKSNWLRYPPPASLAIYAAKRDSAGRYIDEEGNLVDAGNQVLERPYFYNKYGQFQYAFSGGERSKELPNLYYFKMEVGYMEYLLNKKLESQSGNEEGEESEGVEMLQEIYLAPLNPDANYQRVILKSSAAEENPLIFNIRYVKYR